MRRWAGAVAARPKLVILVALVLALGFGLFGADVQDRVSAAGFSDPGSEAALVDQVVRARIGPQNPDVIAIYTVPDGQSLTDLGPRVQRAVAHVDPGLLAHRVETYWNNVPPRQGYFRSADGRQALAVVYAAGDENQRIAAYRNIAAALRVPGVETRFTGYSALADAITVQSRHDLVVAESVSLPVTLVILVLVFGGLVAAALPVLVGLLAVLGSLGAVGLIARVTEVSVFAVNIASLLALGLAIDYGLFVVSRFREELAAGRAAPEAVARTLATAGRTVGFSALLLACAFAGTFVFPQAVLRSLGFGAIAAVALAAVLSLTVLPAALVLIGPRIGKWSWRADAFERGERRAARFWGRVVAAVMRRPAVVAAAIGALLLTLASLLGGVRLGDVDHTALPAGSAARTTVDELAAHFPAANSGATVLVSRTDGTAPTAADADRVGAEIGGVRGVHQVLQVGRDADVVVLHAALDVPDRSEPATEIVTRIRNLGLPGIALRVGGESAATVDSVHAIVSRIPLMIAVMVAATLLLLLLAFRSMVLPIKAVLMAFLSLAATFGILTWIFYRGHLAGMLAVSVGPLSAGMLVLIMAVVFGLSTDYEVFLLSRMVEAHHAGADTAEAVRTGIVKTARVITAAATLLVFITGAFTLSPLTPMRFLGLGMIIALIIDATLVRMLLVPALVKLMGPANWWMPGRRAPQSVRVVERERLPLG
ncbi:MMPL family transporter [Nocardia terpenica]|uniref:MMPL family transporter n=1 Tax=Nocardia terpenica TaxID=455432 RepID=UPI0018962E73|nr:MMPL family transporter [Nocardia terpenica]MBF6063988.1 MMPL family transporter [Nocardia terpenica]MBF6107776.1 MMPL family transporter [Nocardia terpenica]MBF6114844.1 MMPL family transporter [Nocardia terpenica]MBF6121169.1 MMPL family transporter [Nocardia terpenica]MBF6153289.1 MMPL family transporter [Nocardia terpenica]